MPKGNKSPARGLSPFAESSEQKGTVPVGSPTSESQAAEAATIGWMLCVLTGTVCELGVVAARLYFAWRPDATVIGTAGELLLFASAIVGALTLILIPVVHKVRRVKPPLAVTAYAAAIGLIPWLVLLRQSLG